MISSTFYIRVNINPWKFWASRGTRKDGGPRHPRRSRIGNMHLSRTWELRIFGLRQLCLDCLSANLEIHGAWHQKWHRLPASAPREPSQFSGYLSFSKPTTHVDSKSVQKNLLKEIVVSRTALTVCILLIAGPHLPWASLLRNLPFDAIQWIIIGSDSAQGNALGFSFQ